MDLRWLDDLDQFGAETEDAEEELKQDLYHVIEQDLGSNLDDPERGLGVANLLSDVLPHNFTENAAVELMKDERVAGVSVTIERTTLDGITEQDVLSVQIQPTDDLLQQLNLQVPLGTSTTPQA